MGMLDNKVAFITGAASGIGAGTARRFAEEGAQVVLADVQAEEGEKLQQEIAATGRQALYVECDVSSPESVQAAIAAAVEKFGRLDIVFANAGINGVWAPIEDLQPEEWDRTIAINLRGTYLTIHYTVPHLKRAGGGAIIITSSINGTRTFASAGATAYSCTKAAQVAMTQMLALELAKHRIRVNAVCPGRIETDIEENTSHRHTEEASVPAEYPQGNIPLTGTEPGTSEEVAELVLFLASDRSKHITGTPVWIDGGQSLLV